MRSLIFVIFVLAICGCQKEKRSDSNSDLMVKISDPQLVKIIKDYLQEFKPDPKRSYIHVRIYSIGQREIIYIGHESGIKYDIWGYPSYLSSMDDHLIFIYSGANRYVSSNIDSIIMYYSGQFGIKNNSTDEEIFHPEVWKLTRCEMDSFFINRRGSTLRDDYAPCGYIIDTHNLKLDTMNMAPINYDSIVRKNLGL